MGTQVKPKKAQGPIQFVEGIWGKISNDPGIRGALNKTRNFISNGPFIAIVVGTGESKPVAFAVVPLLGLAPAGRVVQAIEEATSGKPISVNSALTALQSLGAVSVPGMVVGTLVSGAVNAIDLLTKRGVPKNTAPNMKIPNSTRSTLDPTQKDTLQVRQDIRDVEGGSEVVDCGLPSGDAGSTLTDSDVSEEGIADDRVHITESSQDATVKGDAPYRYWYEVIYDRARTPIKSKL
ncbi:unnamed protein product [Rhizoctonia solani]|uniref:Uncharacterized protein n=1 Tax=Rhizoctonia solani TaxID=456999 RepID=A0A8H3CEA5_9AGAM|nr:unnamed protein product [Rhizoctonia solani]